MDWESYFKHLIDKNKLSHAYLFWGDINIAFDAVFWLANYLEKNPRVLVDAKFIDSVNGTIGIDQVREINNFLWQKPLTSLRKILIIKEAGDLTHQAQNALLKITEEPSPHGLLLLIVNKLEELLPTLLSRFQKVRVASAIQATVLDKAKEFIKAPRLEKIDMIKKILNNENHLEEFVKSVMIELDNDPVKNFKPLKELLARWTFVCQHNTNKRLQLEAWIESF